MGNVFEISDSRSKKLYLDTILGFLFYIAKEINLIIEQTLQGTQSNFWIEG